MIDLHAHVLPALDDGPQDMAGAVALCAQAADDGTQTIVASPHMLNGVFFVTPQQIRDGVVALEDELRRQAIPLRVLPGADVHAVPDVVESVRDRRVMTIADGGRYLLLELDHDVIAPGIERLLFGLRLAGVTPIVTHPERIGEVQRNPERIRPLVEAGIPMQLTAMSLTGDFGPEAHACALTLVRRQLVHFVASDAHSARHRGAGLAAARKVVAGLVGEDTAAQVFVDRPRAVIEGRPITLPEPIDDRKPEPFWSRWIKW